MQRRNRLGSTQIARRDGVACLQCLPVEVWSLMLSLSHEWPKGHSLTIARD